MKYLTAECNYGGRVTDDKDRRLITTLLDDYYCSNTINNPAYKFGLLDYYKVPDVSSHSEFIEHIRTTLPLVSPPDVFGFHPNADITKDMNETNLITESLLTCNSAGGSSGGGGSKEDTLNKVCTKILESFPNVFNLEYAEKKYPVDYH